MTFMSRRPPALLCAPALALAVGAAAAAAHDPPADPEQALPARSDAPNRAYGPGVFEG